MPLSQYLRLIDIQARMLLKADASKYKFGYLWWVIEPALYVAIFYVVFNIVLDSNRGDFLPFLMTGKFAFIWFSKTVLQASNSIMTSKGLIGRVDIPKTIFPMAAVQESLYKQAVVYLLLIGTLIFFGYSITLSWLWLIPILLVYYLIIVACSFLGAYLVCVLRDFSKAIPLGMTFMLFTSGIFWDVRDIANEEKMNLVLTLNPIAFMLDAHRQVLLYNTAPDVLHLLQLAVVMLVVIFIMSALMRRYSQAIALKVLTS
jgi:homopolymeric O-antigen transport system permease protein